MTKLLLDGKHWHLLLAASPCLISSLSIVLQRMLGQYTILPADTWHGYDVAVMSMRRNHVTSTSVRRQYDVMYLLGWILNTHQYLSPSSPQGLVAIFLKEILQQVPVLQPQYIAGYNTPFHFTQTTISILPLVVLQSQYDWTAVDEDIKLIFFHSL